MGIRWCNGVGTRVVYIALACLAVPSLVYIAPACLAVPSLVLVRPGYWSRPGYWYWSWPGTGLGLVLYWALSGSVPALSGLCLALYLARRRTREAVVSRRNSSRVDRVFSADEHLN